MLYIPDSVNELHRPYVARAHSERARLMSGLLASAVTGVWNLARWASGGLGRLGRAVVSGVIRGHRRRVAIRELLALDDRLLKDIGISRGQIPVVVEGKLAAPRGAETETASQCEIATFPDQRANATDARKSVRRAA